MHYLFWHIDCSRLVALAKLWLLLKEYNPLLVGYRNLTISVIGHSSVIDPQSSSSNRTAARKISYCWAVSFSPARAGRRRAARQPRHFVVSSPLPYHRHDHGETHIKQKNNKPARKGSIVISIHSFFLLILLSAA